MIVANYQGPKYTNARDGRVIFPETLDLSKVRDDPNREGDQSDCQYRLQSLITSPNTAPTANGTHYIAFVRRDGTIWTRLNDRPRETKQTRLSEIRKASYRPRLLVYVREHSDKNVKGDDMGTGSDGGAKSNASGRKRRNTDSDGSQSSSKPPTKRPCGTNPPQTKKPLQAIPTDPNDSRIADCEKWKTQKLRSECKRESIGAGGMPNSPEKWRAKFKKHFEQQDKDYTIYNILRLRTVYDSIHGNDVEEPNRMTKEDLVKGLIEYDRKERSQVKLLVRSKTV